MSSVTKKIDRIITLNVVFTYIFGILSLAIGSGIFLLNFQGSVEINIFEFTLKTTNIGLAAIFLGAVVVIINTARILETLDRMRGLDSKQDAHTSPEETTKDSASVEILEKEAEKSPDDLLDDLDSQNDRVQIEAMKKLGELKFEPALNKVLSMLTEEHSELKSKAIIEFLGCFGDDAAQLLEEKLRNR